MTDQDKVAVGNAILRALDQLAALRGLIDDLDRTAFGDLEKRFDDLAQKCDEATALVRHAGMIL